MSGITSGVKYTRDGVVRTVSGVLAIGQGKGVASKAGRVWWRESGSKERHCTVAEFRHWLGDEEQP